MDGVHLYGLKSKSQRLCNNIIHQSKSCVVVSYYTVVVQNSVQGLSSLCASLPWLSVKNVNRILLFCPPFSFVFFSSTSLPGLFCHSLSPVCLSVYPSLCLSLAAL